MVLVYTCIFLCWDHGVNAARSQAELPEFCCSVGVVTEKASSSEHKVHSGNSQSITIG